jgi:hypothetical protein
MKHLKQILFTLSILLSITSLSFALDVCPGETKNMTWSSSNSTSCTPAVTGSIACSFSPQANVAGSKMVSVPSGTGSGNFCQSTITCSGASQSVTAADTLYVRTLGWCQMQGRGKCPAGQVADTSSYTEIEQQGEGETNTVTYYRINEGTGCVAPTATITGGSCIIPENASSCTNALSWNTNGASFPQITNANTGAMISTAPSASGMTYTTPYGGVQIQIRNNGVMLNSVTLGASCIAGTVS